MRALLVLVMAATMTPMLKAFGVAQPRLLRSTTTELYGLLNRFRKKKQPDQVATIVPGGLLPAVDVERVVVAEDGSLTSEVVSIQDVLGSAKAILVGALVWVVCVCLWCCLRHQTLSEKRNRTP